MLKYLLTIILLLGVLQIKAQQQLPPEKLILGKWKYDISYDTIAVVDTSHFHGKWEAPLFFLQISFKKSMALLSDLPEKRKAMWEINNGNELYFYLDDKKVLKYRITKLTKRALELRTEGVPISTLGYKR